MGNSPIKSFSDGQALNIKAPAAEQSSHPGKDAGLIFHQDTKGMPHDISPFTPMLR